MRSHRTVPSAEVPGWFAPSTLHRVDAFGLGEARSLGRLKYLRPLDGQDEQQPFAGQLGRPTREREIEIRPGLRDGVQHAGGSARLVFDCCRPHVGAAHLEFHRHGAPPLMVFT